MVNRPDFGLATWRDRNSVLVKTVSIALLLTFLAYDVTWAQGVIPMWQNARPSGTTVPDKNRTAINGISIPSGLGKINYADSNGNKTIINIQDAHASFSAQNSIVNLLDHLTANYDLNLIAVEGSEGYIDTSILRTFPDKEIRRKTASSLMEEGRMSAGEFYAIISEKPVALYGIEDNRLYKKNVELFKSVMEEKAVCVRNVEALENVLTDLENKVYGKELREFVRASDSHRSGVLNFSKYWENASALIKSKNVDISGHKNIDRLLFAIALEKEISFEKANRERDNLIAGLSEKLSKAELEDLALKSISFKKGDSSQTEFHNYLVALAERSNLDPAPYKNLIAFARYIAIYETVDILRLYSELDSIEGSLRGKLYVSDDERTLYDLRQKAKTLKGLFSVSLNNDGAEYLLAHKNEFDSEEISSFITKSCAKYGIAVKGDSNLPYIIGRLDEAIKFYNVVRERDNVMLKNTIDKMAAEKQNVAALITGGFHSQGLADLTREKGLSYLIIMPKFEQGKERPYIAILTNKKGSYERLIKSGQYKLAVHQFFSTTDNFDRAAAMAMTMRNVFNRELKGGSNERAIKALNETVREWIKAYTEAYNLPTYRKDNLAANKPTPEQFANLANGLKAPVIYRLFNGMDSKELREDRAIVYTVSKFFPLQEKQSAITKVAEAPKNTNDKAGNALLSFTLLISTLISGIIYPDITHALPISSIGQAPEMTIKEFLNSLTFLDFWTLWLGGWVTIYLLGWSINGIVEEFKAWKNYRKSTETGKTRDGEKSEPKRIDVGSTEGVIREALLKTASMSHIGAAAHLAKSLYDYSDKILAQKPEEREYEFVANVPAAIRIFNNAIGAGDSREKEYLMIIMVLEELSELKDHTRLAALINSVRRSSEKINAGADVEGISPATADITRSAVKQEEPSVISSNKIGVPVIDELADKTLKDKKVLLRLDWNVSNAKGEIKDDTRIKETLDTLTYPWHKGATIIVTSHNGRPKGKVTKELSLGPVAKRLKELLKEKGQNIPVVFHEGSITENGLAEGLGDKIVPGAINILENTRYFAGEEKNDENFSRALAALADNNLFVFDAFGAAERVHSSTGGAAKYMNNVAVGFLMKKEYRYLQGALDSLYGLIIGGGPKVSEKVPVVKNVIKNIARGGFIIIGSGPVAAFLKVRYGIEIGQKPTDQDVVDAREIFALAEANGVRVILPVDLIVSERNLSEKTEGDKSWLDLQKIPEGTKIVNLTVGRFTSAEGTKKQTKDLYAYDVGRVSRDVFRDVILKTPEGKAVFYNGMLGVEELKEFSEGSKAISRTLIEATDDGVITVIGGGDTTKSAKKNKIDKLVTHCSTGGGASAAFLKGEELQAMKVLKERVRELKEKASVDAAKKAPSKRNSIVICVPEVIGKDRHTITDAEKSSIASTINTINDRRAIPEEVELVFYEGIKSDEKSVRFAEDAARARGAVMGIPVRSDISVDELVDELKGNFLTVISRDLFGLTSPDITALDETRAKLMDKGELARIIVAINKVMPAIVSENLSQLSIYNMRMTLISRQTASGLISDEVVFHATAERSALSIGVNNVGEMKLLAEEHWQKMKLARSLGKNSVPVKLEVRLTVDEKSPINRGNIGDILTRMGIDDVLNPEDVILVDSNAADAALKDAYDRLTASGYSSKRIAIVDRAVENRQDVPEGAIFAEYEDDIVTASHYDAGVELLALSAKPDDLQLSIFDAGKKWFKIKPITKVDFDDQLRREIEQYEKVLIAA